MTEKAKLTGYGSDPMAGVGSGMPLAISQSSLIVSIASISQACAGASPSSTSGAIEARSAAVRAASPNWNPALPNVDPALRALTVWPIGVRQGRLELGDRWSRSAGWRWSRPSTR